MNYMNVLDYVVDHWETIIAIGGVLWGWYQRRYGLPKQARWALRQLKKCGLTPASIQEMLSIVAGRTDLSNEEKRAMAAAKLKECAGDVELSTPIANLIVEWAYSRWLATLKR